MMLLCACCDTSDSRVSDGYPYSGNIIDLKIVEYNNHPSKWDNDYFIHFNPDSFYISDSNTCHNVFSFYDADYICNINFKKYDLVLTRGHARTHQIKTQKRALINHKTKTYTIEIRGYTKTCGDSPINTKYFSEFILVPKIPEGYTFETKRYHPIQ
jgi:hypothetical protein